MTDKKLSDIEIDGHLASICQLAVVMLRTGYQTDKGAPGCWFGGQPTLPEHIEWPTYTYPSPLIHIPLHFLLQVDLRYVPRGMPFPDFPENGTLFVFIEPILAPFDELSPVRPMLNNQGARVIYVPEDVSQCPPRMAPPLPDFDEEYADFGTLRQASEYSGYWGMRAYGIQEAADGLHRWPIRFALADTIPGYEPGNGDECVAERMDEIQQGIYNFCESYRPVKLRKSSRETSIILPHRMFGASDSQTFNSREHLDAIGAPHAWPALTENHVVLFRLHAQDAAIGFDWVQSRSLGFWIDKAHLAVGNFDKVVVWEEN